MNKTQQNYEKLYNLIKENYYTLDNLAGLLLELDFDKEYFEAINELLECFDNINKGGK